MLIVTSFKKIYLILAAALLALFLLPTTSFAAWSNGVGARMLRADSGDNVGEVKLTWLSSGEVDNYDLVYGTASGVYTFGVNSIGNTNYFVVRSLTPGVTYYFKLLGKKSGAVVSVNGDVGAVARSGKVAAATVKTVAQVPSYSQTAPAPVVMAPTGYNPQALKGDYNGEIQITWVDDANTDNYHLSYTDDLSTWRFGASNLGDTNYFVVKSLVPGKTYYFKLLAVKKNGSTWTSGVFSAVARVGQVRPGTVAMAAVGGVSTPVAMPTGIWASKGLMKGTAVVSWNPVMGANNYDIVYGTQSGMYTFGAQNVGNMGSYTVMALESGKTYYFKILSKKNWSEPMTWSGEVSAVAR